MRSLRTNERQCNKNARTYDEVDVKYKQSLTHPFGRKLWPKTSLHNLLTRHPFLKQHSSKKGKAVALHNMPSTLSRYEFHWAADSSVGDITGAVNLNKMSAGVLRQPSPSQPFLLVLNCPAPCFPRVPKRLRSSSVFSSGCSVL